MKKFIVISSLFLFTLFQGCSIAVSVADYSNSSNWLAKPVKNEYLADVFYIYPTVCMTTRQDNICKFDDL